MFVRKSTYDELMSRYIGLDGRLSSKEKECEGVYDLMSDYRSKLRSAQILNSNLHAQIEVMRRQALMTKPISGEFTREELKSMRRLVHPDKHNGKESSVKITQKINELIERDK